jgi:integrase
MGRPGSPHAAGVAPYRRANSCQMGRDPDRVMVRPRRLSDVIEWRNEYSHQPRTADHQITVLNHLLGWARQNGIIHLNVAANIRRLYKNGARAEIIWLEEEIERYCNAAPTAVADGIRLAAKTGLRRADLIGLTWAEVELLRVKRVTLKSGRRRKRAMIPVTPDLRALLDELATRPRRSDVNTVLVNSRGKSWSGDGFGHRFNEVRDDLDIRTAASRTCTMCAEPMRRDWCAWASRTRTLETSWAGAPSKWAKYAKSMSRTTRQCRRSSTG